MSNGARATHITGPEPAYVAIYVEGTTRTGYVVYITRETELEPHRIQPGFIGLMGHQTEGAANADRDNWITTGFRKNRRSNDDE